MNVCGSPMKLKWGCCTIMNIEPGEWSRYGTSRLCTSTTCPQELLKDCWLVNDFWDIQIYKLELPLRGIPPPHVLHRHSAKRFTGTSYRRTLSTSKICKSDEGSPLYNTSQSRRQVFHQPELFSPEHHIQRALAAPRIIRNAEIVKLPNYPAMIRRSSMLLAWSRLWYVSYGILKTSKM